MYIAHGNVTIVRSMHRYVTLSNYWETYATTDTTMTETKSESANGESSAWLSLGLTIGDPAMVFSDKSGYVGSYQVAGTDEMNQIKLGKNWFCYDHKTKRWSSNQGKSKFLIWFGDDLRSAKDE